MEQEQLERVSSYAPVQEERSSIIGASMPPPPFQLQAGSGFPNEQTTSYGSGPLQRTIAETSKESEKPKIQVIQMGSTPTKSRREFDPGDTVADLASHLNAHSIQLFQGSTDYQTPKGAARKKNHLLECNMGSPLMEGGQYGYYLNEEFEARDTSDNQLDATEATNIVQGLSMLVYKSLRESGKDCHEVQGMMMGSSVVLSSNYDDVFEQLRGLLEITKSFSKVDAATVVGGICDLYIKLVVDKNEKFAGKKGGRSEEDDSDLSRVQVEAIRTAFAGGGAVSVVSDPTRFTSPDAALVFLTGQGSASDRSAHKESKNPPLHAEQNLMLALVNYLLIDESYKKDIKGVVLGGVKSPCGSCELVMDILGPALTQFTQQQVLVAEHGLIDSHYGAGKTEESVGKDEYSQAFLNILKLNNKTEDDEERIANLDQLIKQFAAMGGHKHNHSGGGKSGGKRKNVSAEGVELTEEAILAWIQSDIEPEKDPDETQLSNILAITRLSPTQSLNEACIAILGKGSEKIEEAEKEREKLMYRRYNCLIIAMNLGAEPSGEDLIAIRNQILATTNIPIGATLFEDEVILQIIAIRLGISNRNYAIRDAGTIRYITVGANGVITMHAGVRPGDNTTQFHAIDFTAGRIGHFEYDNVQTGQQIVQAAAGGAGGGKDSEKSGKSSEKSGKSSDQSKKKDT